MKISMIQFSSVKFQIEKNYEKVLNFMQDAISKKTDIIVLPELFDTGFFPSKNLEKFADKNAFRAREIFSNFARENCVNIVAGSICEMRNDKLFNASYIFDKNGKIIANYDKIHLFSTGNEKESEIFTPGEKIISFRLNEIPCGIMICYDLRFAEIAKILALRGISVLFVVAKWPLKRIKHFEILAKARAIENEFFVCALNGFGNSILINPNGDEILKFDLNEGVKTAEINLDEIMQARDFLHVFEDRKPEIYKEIL